MAVIVLSFFNAVAIITTIYLLPTSHYITLTIVNVMVHLINIFWYTDYHNT